MTIENTPVENPSSDGIQEHINATGHLSVVLRDENGDIKDERSIPNLVVTVGKNWIASRMKTTGIPNEMSHMAIGSGTATPVVGDSTMGTELGRVALTSSVVTSATIEYIATFPAGSGTGAVTEAGIFNNSSAGTMLCHTAFSVVNKGASDSLTITWDVTIS
jgi:hypothetical protein